MSISDKFLKSHSVLCDSELDDSFIDKSKYQYVVDKMPTVELTKLSKDEFNDGILKLAEFDVSKIGNKSCGTIFHVDKDSLKIPAVYDVLCEILLHVDTDVRLRAFSDITENYYNKTLSKYDLTKDQFSTQLRLFLPYAKFERLYHSCKKENIDDIKKSALEVEECIQYPVLYREECYAILKHIYKTKEADLISFEAVPANDLPGNLGKYYKIKLTARNGTETETHRLFAKIVDKDNPDLREFSMVPFGKEQFFFETLLKKCEELGLEELTDVCPKCYFAGNDKLLFEDLSADGYSSWNFHIPVSYNWLETTVKKLAKLHAMSIIFEEKLSEKTGKIVRLDEEFPEGVAEAAFLDREDIRSFRESYKKCVGEYLLPRCLSESEGGRLDTLKEKIYEASDRIYVLVQKSDKIRNVYSHGDMWGANVMYKEDQATQTPSAYLIDFQLTRYCSPSVDLMFLLYANTDRTSRLKHVKDLIEVYYKELTNILSSYEIDAGNIFTLEQLKDSCREAEPSIICTALMYGQFLLMPDEFKKEMMSDKVRSRKFFTGDRKDELEKIWYYDPFRTRVEGLIEDAIRIFDEEM